MKIYGPAGLAQVSGFENMAKVLSHCSPKSNSKYVLCNYEHRSEYDQNCNKYAR